MIAGMTTLTFVHVVISLVAIFSGLIVVLGMISGRKIEGLTGLFLATTVLTSVTGFFFPYHGVTPGVVVGIISLIVLVVAIFARYSRHLVGGWRKTYVITSVLALYLNCFVFVVQLFEKAPALHALLPKGSEPPFGIAQVPVMVVFIVLGIYAVKGYRAQTSGIRTQVSRAA
jgi:hypothetical protein